MGGWAVTSDTLYAFGLMYFIPIYSKIGVAVREISWLKCVVERRKREVGPRTRVCETL